MYYFAYSLSKDIIDKPKYYQYYKIMDILLIFDIVPVKA